MRPTCAYAVFAVVFLSSNISVATAERYALLPRQDTSSASGAAISTPIPDTKSSETLQSTNIHSPTSGSSLAPSSSGATITSSSARGTDTPSGSAKLASDASAASSTSAGVTASPIPKGSLNVTSTNNDTLVDGLPIEPRITPGISVAGALMLLTGAFYTLIGIKTKWIHIFGSSAYLVSLAVTVLILYVMHPPISDGLQGAYVAAIICTGALLGALSLLFKDVTEGFATFLGGFCLSMWFLVLTPGGLIANDVGKVTFIAIMTVSAFALYISHHTRPYGLIGSTSFGGATVIVLGIDCFSRAGLKEFWLYIWSLNDGLFPLHYHQKYPITRGIRVEIAAIIIISLAGIMSQLKVWKIIKQKREERASEQRRKEHQRNLSDEERGKMVEENNKHDRPLWEASHGTKSAMKVQEGYLDSGVGTSEPSSTRKSSLGDMRNSSAEGMELQEMPGSGKNTDDGGRITVHVAQDDFFEIPLAGSQRTSLERHVLAAGGPSTRAASEASSLKSAAKGTKVTIDPNLTLQPKVVPPPFKIPDLDSASDDDGSSVEASAPSEHLPDRGSKRLSTPSIFRKASKRSRSSYHAGSTSDEALMVPHVDDDRASSIAATQDGVSQDGISEHGDFTEPLNYSRSPTPVVERVMDKASLDALVAGSHDEVLKTDGMSDQIPETIALPGSRPTSMALDEQVEDQNAKEPLAAEGSIPAAEPIRLQGNLPDGGSKVVKAYRTNEWAKHLDKAGAPEVEEPRLNKRQTDDKPRKVEQAAPVDVHALQQTPVTAEPGPIGTNSSQTHMSSSRNRPSNFMSKNPFSKHKQQDAPPKAQPALHPLTVAKNAERNPSQTSLANTASRTSSQTSLTSTGSQGNKIRPSLPQARSSQNLGPYRSGYRSSSTPLVSTPLADSPIKEDVESSFPDTRFTPHSAHLMSQRDRIITSRPSSTSLLRTSYSNVSLDQHPAYSSIPEDSDDVPLTKRKSFLQQNPQAVPLTRRSSAGPSGTISPRLSSGSSTPVRNLPFRSPSNPHPVPVRPGLAPRDSTISAWRTSLKPDTTAYLENQNMEARRADLMKEKARESTSRLEGNMKQGVKASVIDQGMRRGDMLSAHQAAMRKLQGEAKI